MWAGFSQSLPNPAMIPLFFDRELDLTSQNSTEKIIPDINFYFIGRISMTISCDNARKWWYYYSLYRRRSILNPDICPRSKGRHRTCQIKPWLKKAGLPEDPSHSESRDEVSHLDTRDHNLHIASRGQVLSSVRM